MEKYLVGFNDDALENLSFAIVNADNSKDAIRKYIWEVGIHEELFLDHVYDKAANMCLAERFWLQTDEEMDRFEEHDELLIGEEEFRRRAREFFGPHADFAERYLDYYFTPGEEPPTELFPEEMLLYIWAESDWAGEDLIAIPLREIREI